MNLKCLSTIIIIFRLLGDLRERIINSVLTSQSLEMECSMTFHAIFHSVHLIFFFGDINYQFKLVICYYYDISFAGWPSWQNKQFSSDFPMLLNGMCTYSNHIKLWKLEIRLNYCSKMFLHMAFVKLPFLH